MKNLDEMLTLVNSLKSLVVCSIDEEEYPNAKAMLNLEHHDALKTFFFSTNLSAKRTSQFLKNPKASVYAFDPQSFQGLMLKGEVTVCTDKETKVQLWREGFEMYYPQGIDDPDYCVLRFDAKCGNYYHGLNNFNFEV